MWNVKIIKYFMCRQFYCSISLERFWFCVCFPKLDSIKSLFGLQRNRIDLIKTWNQVWHIGDSKIKQKLLDQLNRSQSVRHLSAHFPTILCQYVDYVIAWKSRYNVIYKAAFIQVDKPDHLLLCPSFKTVMLRT